MKWCTSFLALHVFQRHALLVILLVLGYSDLVAQSWNQDDYTGSRCAVVQIREVSIRSNSLSFTCDLANTGKEALFFKKTSSENSLVVYSPLLVFSEDHTLVAGDLEDKRDVIAQAILTSGIRLSPGEYLTNQRFTIKFDIDRQPEKNQDKVTSVVLPAPVLPQVNTEDSAACADLVVDSLWLNNDKKYTLRLSLAIRNQGNAPAKLYQVDGNDEDAMGVSFFLGNTPTISRSSQFIQGAHIRSGLTDTSGWLQPGDSFVWEVKINPAQRPGYLNALQCRLDNFQYVDECDRTNNTFTYYFPE